MGMFLVGAHAFWIVGLDRGLDFDTFRPQDTTVLHGSSAKSGKPLDGNG